MLRAIEILRNDAKDCPCKDWRPYAGNVNDTTVTVSPSLGAYLRTRIVGRSQNMVAERAGVSEALLSRVLGGDHRTRWTSLRPILLSLDITPGDLTQAGFADLAERLSMGSDAGGGVEDVKAALAGVPLRPTTRDLIWRLVDDIAKGSAPLERQRFDDAWDYATQPVGAAGGPRAFTRESWERRVRERLLRKLFEEAE